MAPATAVSSLAIRGCDALVRPGELRESVDVEIAAGRIERIRATGSPPRAGTQVIDGRRLLALPGLVNAHTHSAENCLRGSGSCLPLEVWLTRMFGTAGLYSPEDHYIAAVAGAVEMLRTGTTAVLDHLWMTPASVEATEAVLRAYRDVGIRAAVAPLVADADFTGDLAAAHGADVAGALFTDLAGAISPREVEDQLEELIGSWHGTEEGRLQVFAGPAGVQWCSEELLERAADTARRHGSAITVHLLETRLQRTISEQQYGIGPVQALDRMGVLGRDCSLAHGVWLNAGEIELIAERGAIVVHNPAANFRLGSGRAPVPELLAAGARIALGADGSASSDEQAIWSQLKLAALVHNEWEHDRWMPAASVLEMATAGGAAALRLEDSLGTLQPGSLADVVLVDRRGDGLAGAQDLEAALALSETGRGVTHVIVDGQLVVAHGRCLTVDEAAIREALAGQAARRAAGQRESPELLGAIEKMAAFKRLMRDREREAGAAPAGEARA